MDEQTIRTAFEESLVKLKKAEAAGLNVGDALEMVETIPSFPTNPVAVRRSGASGSQPPQCTTDMTFQEFLESKWTPEDPRPAPVVILENMDGVIKLTEWATLLKTNDLLNS